MSVLRGLICGEIVERYRKKQFRLKNLAGLCLESSAQSAEFCAASKLPGVTHYYSDKKC
jgi:hypothetical protein